MTTERCYSQAEELSESELDHQLKLQKAMEDLQAETTVDVDWLYRNKKKKRSTTGTVLPNATGNPPVSPSTSKATNLPLAQGKTSDSEKTASTATFASTSSTILASTEPLNTDIALTPGPSSTVILQKPAQTTPHSPKAASSKTPVPSPKSTISANTQVTPPTSTTIDTSSRSLLSHALRPRSTSDPKRMAPQPSETIASSSQSTSSPLTRSSSLNEHSKSQKPIKSLFSAFSKFKSNRSSPSPELNPQVTPIQIPKQKQHGQHSLQNHLQNGSTRRSSFASSIESISPTFHTKILHERSDKTLSKKNLEGNGRVILNKNPNRSLLPIKELSELNLRRVTFALDKLSDDPPQQIPSRRPKKGAVIVLEDLLSNKPLKLSIGITNEAKIETKSYDEREIKLIRDSQLKALEEAEKHAQEAHRAAQRIAQEVLTYKQKKTSGVNGKDKEPETEVDVIDKDLSNLEIDKPIHLHEHHFEDEIINNEDNHTEISLSAIYTRCCHLREILPIPATLKQLKGKSSPLQILKLLNPKPTLIDVYSFSDFIAIAPIKYLVFDNVTMTTEMFKIVLSSLLTSTSIEKLSLRNFPIDAQGWKYLCKFLSRNKSLYKLDISQQKIKADLPTTHHRANMDWQLFIDTLVHRGGIEELLVNGCKIPLPQFQSLIEDGVSIKTVRLGVCQIDATIDHLKILMNWATSPNYKCEGLDIGFNDLSNDKLKPLMKRISEAEKLQSISINSTNLVNVEDVALFIRSLSKLPNLRFLDLSNLPQIFPGILPYLNKYLPRFPKLTRLHLDFNEFSTKSIGIIAEIIPKCQNLVRVSIIGLSSISLPAAAFLYGATKSSKSLLNLDLDYELIDENISSRIALTLMRNMEMVLNHHPTNSTTDSHDDILFDGSLIAESAGKLIDKMSSSPTSNKTDDFTHKFLQTQMLEKVSRVRNQVNKTIDDLLEKRSQNGQLKLQEKEDLLRFYFLDTSLAHVVEVFQHFDDIAQGASPQGSHAGSASTNNVHSNAVAPVNETPHQMAIEVNGTPIDMSTGRPVVLRSLSQTSIQAKKQEEEEGEFHRWGFFVQQQRRLLPADATTVINPTTTKPDIVIPKLPSGSEIRDAVIKAKGIDSISALIDNVNHDKFNLNTIYPLVERPSKEVPTFVSDTESDCDEIHVDEAYDKILNDLSRVRSNK